MDIFNDYFLKRFPDQQEKDLKVVSKCYACEEILYENDEVVSWDGILCCDLKECILKMISAKVVTLESGEE